MNKRKRGLIFEYYVPIKEEERRRLIAACPPDVRFLLLAYTLKAHLKKKRVYRIIQVIQEFLTLQKYWYADDVRFAQLINVLYDQLATYVSCKPVILQKDVCGFYWFKAFRALYKHINKQYCIFKLANKYAFLIESFLAYLLEEEVPKPVFTQLFSGSYNDYVYDYILRFRIMKMPKKNGAYALMKYVLPNQMAILVDVKEYFQFIYLVDVSKN